MNTTGAGSMTERVRSYLDARDGEVLELTRDLIRTPSPNPPGDERAVADLVTERLRALGIDEITRVGAEETRPNLLARVRGAAPGPTLVLSGHLDTKPAGDMDAWETDPWDPVLRDGDLVGLGSGDMKAAIAGMVYAAAALKHAQEADAAGGGFAGELVLVFTADEEAGAQLGSKWLADNGHLQADAAVIGEPSGITSEWQSVHLVSRARPCSRSRWPARRCTLRSLIDSPASTPPSRWPASSTAWTASSSRTSPTTSTRCARPGPP